MHHNASDVASNIDHVRGLNSFLMEKHATYFISYEWLTDNQLLRQLTNNERNCLKCASLYWIYLCINVYLGRGCHCKPRLAPWAGCALAVGTHQHLLSQAHTHTQLVVIAKSLVQVYDLPRYDLGSWALLVSNSTKSYTWCLEGLVQM